MKYLCLTCVEKNLENYWTRGLPLQHPGGGVWFPYCCVLALREATNGYSYLVSYEA